MSMKNALIEAISKMSESDAVALWAMVSGIAEDQLEHCDLLAEGGNMTVSALRDLRVAETVQCAGDAALAAEAQS
jgi:hypothetical protein